MIQITHQYRFLTKTTPKNHSCGFILPYIAMTVMVFHSRLGKMIRFSAAIESHVKIASSMDGVDKLQTPQQLNQTP